MTVLSFSLGLFAGSMMTVLVLALCAAAHVWEDEEGDL
jgi:hypothetical protein